VPRPAVSTFIVLFFVFIPSSCLACRIATARASRCRLSSSGSLAYLTDGRANDRRDPARTSRETNGSQAQPRAPCACDRTRSFPAVNHLGAFLTRLEQQQEQQREQHCCRWRYDASGARKSTVSPYREVAVCCLCVCVLCPSPLSRIYPQLENRNGHADLFYPHHATPYSIRRYHHYYYYYYYY
jgi:hypothetical protein